MCWEPPVGHMAESWGGRQNVASAGRSTQILHLSKSKNAIVSIVLQVKVLNSECYSSKSTKVLSAKST